MKKRRIGIFFISFILLCGCTSGPTQNVDTPMEEKPLSSPTSNIQIAHTPTSTEEVLPTPTNTPAPVIIYSEDFEDVNTGWERYNEYDGTLDYENGAYRMRVNATNNLFWVQAVLPEPMENVAIQVTTTLLESQPDAPYGLICRLDGKNQYYYFFITGNGHYGIGKFLTSSGMEQVILADDGGQTSNVIQQGINAINTILVVCNNEKLTLTINGTLLLETEDDQLKKGDLALLAGVRTESGIDVLFDDFIVMEP